MKATIHEFDCWSYSPQLRSYAANSCPVRCLQKRLSHTGTITARTKAQEYIKSKKSGGKVDEERTQSIDDDNVDNEII